MDASEAKPAGIKRPCVWEGNYKELSRWAEEVGLPAYLHTLTLAFIRSKGKGVGEGAGGWGRKWSAIDPSEWP